MMKKALILTLIALFGFTWTYSQEEGEEIQTIFSGVSSNGIYGGLSLGYSEIDQRHAIIVGARGAWIINHSLGIGLSGKVFANEYEYDALEGEDVNLQGGYGGFLIEPILGGQQRIHLSVPILIGAGGIVHADEYDHDRYYDDYHSHRDYINDSEAFFVLEPGVELELNMLRFFRISLGGYYRYTSQIDLYDTPSDVLNGFSYEIAFKFGKF
jgi:hypothetical protein